jgi:hypothetical protein
MVLRLRCWRVIAVVCALLAFGPRPPAHPAGAQQGPTFCDVPPTHPAYEAITALAERGTIRGYGDGCFGPDDPVVRAQMAALVARMMGWEGEDHGNPFSDQGGIDGDLWRNVGTLAHYGVARGYPDGTYQPASTILGGQVISLIARAMVAKGAWQPAPDHPSIYPNVPAESGQRGDLATFVKYAGAIPDTAAGAPWAGWDRGSTRSWVARALWQLMVTTGIGGGTPAPPASGVAYYVDSAAGDDANPGTSAGAAWRTLGRAGAAPLAPGDRLLLRRGGRWSGGLTVARSGTAAAPIVVAAYGDGPLPVLTGASSCVTLAGWHITLREVQADGCSWAGVELAGGENRVEDSLITRNVTGVHIRAGAVRNAVVRNEIRDNNRMKVLTPGGSDDSGAFGVLLQGDDNDVSYNTITGSAAFSHDFGQDGAAVEVYGGRGNHVHHNTAVDNDAFTELGDARAADNTFAYNVVRSALPTSTFLVTRGARSGWGPVARTRVYHNTVLLTGGASQGFVCDSGCDSGILILRNNVIQAVAKAGYADGAIDEDHNLYWGGRVQFATGPHTLVADPAFVAPGAGDLRPRADSPALDRGAPTSYTRDRDGAVVPRGPAPDLGAYER